MRKWRWILVGVALAVASGHARSDDPFQSAPGPEPPKQTSRPRSSRPAPDVPQPSAIPGTSPEVSDKSNNRDMRFDGLWVGLWENKKASVSYPFVMEVKNNNVAKLNSRTELPDTPGYDNYSGTISPDGRVFMTRHAVGEGIIPGALPRGKAVTEVYDGLFSGDNFTATSTSNCCHIQLTRRR